MDGRRQGPMHDIDLHFVASLARRAGEAILEIYQRDFSIQEKEDRSPLTDADRRSNDLILSALQEAHPEIPCLSEESKALDFSERRHWMRFWLIDPLDGTKEFIKKNGEFTVNIALIESGVPVLGVVYQPCGDVLYQADRLNGATKQIGQSAPVVLPSSHIHYLERQTVRVVASRSHMSPETEAFVENLRRAGKTVEFTSSGSSLKICLVAEGAADVYPRFAPTMEWDTAAAHAIATFAGRRVSHWTSGHPLIYNKPDLLNPWFLVD